MGAPFIEIGTTERGSAASEEGDKYSLDGCIFCPMEGGQLELSHWKMDLWVQAQ